MAAPFSLRSLIAPVYLPTFLFAIGQGAVIPAIPLFARNELEASAAIAGLIVFFRGFGILVFDIPAGLLITRFGERMAMFGATLGLAVIAVAAGLSPSIWFFAVLSLAMGFAWSVWLLARLSFVAELAPVQQRGRALSLIGGTQRMGNFVGPALGGFVANAYGNDAAFYIQAVLAIAAFLVLAFIAPKGEGHEAPAGHSPAFYTRLGSVVQEHYGVFLTAGVATAAIGVLRASRSAVIPLWGDDLGLSSAEIGLIFSISAALDMTLFYPVGIVMDRFGRKWVGVPCLAFMTVGFLLIPLTDTFTTLLLASLLTSLGNGFGSGIVMTLGADFSPRIGRADFLGVWRVIGDMGTAGGPAVIAAVAAVGTLGMACVAVGGIGLAGTAVMAFLVAEPLRRHDAAQEERETRKEKRGLPDDAGDA